MAGTIANATVDLLIHRVHIPITDGAGRRRAHAGTTPALEFELVGQMRCLD